MLEDQQFSISPPSSVFMQMPATWHLQGFCDLLLARQDMLFAYCTQKILKRINSMYTVCGFKSETLP